ncbi:MAG: cell division protein FtsZ [Treponema sp.]|jgi:cell division protein FtsZ|nr:cell division protein FtsZ [Treponema sp.]
MNVLAVKEMQTQTNATYANTTYASAAQSAAQSNVVQPQILKFKPQENSGIQPEGKIRKTQGRVSAVIKVISAGGGGANAVNRMIENGLSGVEFIAVNTDLQDLCEKSLADVKVQIGSRVTGGHGAGGVPEKGERAALEDIDAIAEALSGAHMVFVTSGMGGGTGTGSAPVIAKIAKEQGALTVAVVTTPFEFEGRYKMKLALEGIEKLRKEVDTLIVIPNEYLFKIVDNTYSYNNAYYLADKVLCQGVQGISDIITKTGFQNVDFADVETIMKNKGDALMGIGFGSGDNRAFDAVKNAIDNPLLEDTNIEGATGVLVNIAGPANITLVEIQSIIKTVKEKCDPYVHIIPGILEDPELGDGIQVTVIATGFPSSNQNETKPVETFKTSDSVIINCDEYDNMIERTKRPEYLSYLPQREYQDDLDVPSVLRNYRIQKDEKSLDAALSEVTKEK